MPYRKLAEAILTDWRAADRDLAVALANGDVAEHARLIREIDRLREEYQRLTEEAARNMQPALPPFPPSRETPSH